MIIALARYQHTSIPDVLTQLELTQTNQINPDIAKSALTQAH